MPANDGVLLLVARQDRKARIELGAGYGKSRDADAARIMERSILPHFRDDDYGEGITEGVRAIAAELASLRFGFPPGSPGSPARASPASSLPSASFETESAVGVG